jgi:feruloyl esterase
MRSAALRTPRQWGDLVRAATDHQGPWPRISIWHGGLDTTVNVNNAQASVAQWADLHGLSLAAGRQDLVDGAIRLGWDDKLEVYTLPVLGHGTPIDSGDVGQPGPFILEAGISSSRRIAEFWGLASVRSAKVGALPEIEHILMPHGEHADISARSHEGLILRALKAAGLIKR